MEGVSVNVAGGATTDFRIRLKVDKKGRECRIKPSLRCLSIRCILSWLYLIGCALHNTKFFNVLTKRTPIVHLRPDGARPLLPSQFPKPTNDNPMHGGRRFITLIPFVGSL